MWIYCLIVFSGYLIISGIAYLVNKSNKKQGLKGIPTKDCFNPLKWLSVLYGFTLKILIPRHVFEQYVLRMYDPDCSVCIKEGKCIGGLTCGNQCACGCDTIAKMYSPTEADSGENWGPIIFNKKEYQELRKDYPVKITITYDN